MVVHRITRSGGSCVVVIPKTYLGRFNLVARDYVVVNLRKDYIEIRPLRRYPKMKGRIRI